MAESSSRRQSRRSVDPPTNDAKAEFTACLSLYSTLTWRFTRSAPFLYRTLRRDVPSPRRTNVQALPTVRYVAADDSINWWRKISKMRCLWCARRVYRFADDTELMQHLQTCHGRFKYEFEKKKPTGSKSHTETIVYMSLRDDPSRLSSTSADLITEAGEDDVYINPAKYGRRLKKSSSTRAKTKRTSSSYDELQTPKRQRPSRACVTTTPKSEDAKIPVDAKRTEDAKMPEELRKPSSRSVPAQQSRSKTKPTKTRSASVKVEKATPAYKNAAHAVKEKRLWHSILQHPVSLEEFQAEDDSDEDREEEYEWRLHLADDEVEEFEDTLPVEKLLMNLWNQFLVMDYHAYADHRVAPACNAFAKKYRRIIQKFNLEVTFLRHLTELGRIGLLDSDAICDIGMILRNRDTEPVKEEEGARFLFAERIIRQADEEAGKKRTQKI